MSIVKKGFSVLGRSILITIIVTLLFATVLTTGLTAAAVNDNYEYCSTARMLEGKIKGLWLLEFIIFDSERADITEEGMFFNFDVRGDYTEYYDYSPDVNGEWAAKDGNTVTILDEYGITYSFDKIVFKNNYSEMNADFMLDGDVYKVELSRVEMTNSSSSSSSVGTDTIFGLNRYNDYTKYTSDEALNTLLPGTWNNYRFFYGDGKEAMVADGDTIFYSNGGFRLTEDNKIYTGEWYVYDGMLTLSYDKSRNYKVNEYDIYIIYNIDRDDYYLYYTLAGVIGSDVLVQKAVVGQNSQSVVDTPTMDTVYTVPEEILELLARNWQDYRCVYADGTWVEPAEYRLNINRDGTAESYYDGVTRADRWYYEDGILTVVNKDYNWYWDIEIEYSADLNAYLLYLHMGTINEDYIGDYFVMISYVNSINTVVTTVRDVRPLPTQYTRFTSDIDLSELLIREWYSYMMIDSSGSLQGYPPDWHIILEDDGTITTLAAGGFVADRWSYRNGVLSFTNQGYENAYPIYIDYAPEVDAYLLYINMSPESGADTYYQVMISYPTEEEIALRNQTAGQADEFVAPDVFVDSFGDDYDSYLDGYSAADAELVSRMIGDWRYYQYIDAVGNDFNVDYDATSEVFIDGTFRDFEGDTIYTGTWKVKNGVVTYYYNNGSTLRFGLEIVYSSSEGKDLMYLKKLDGETKGDIAVYIKED